jgi:anti-anti-sigma factor
MDLGTRRLANAVVLAPTGRIDHGRSEEFKAALAGPLAGCVAGGDAIVLDLAGVEYMSSAGLRVLMLAAKQVRAQGGTLVVAALQPLVKEIFEISRFTAVFEVFATVREALARVSPSALAAFDAV